MSNEDVTPHANGRAWCDDCGHEWTAVWPLGADALECPKCRSTDTDRETNVDRSLNGQARTPAAPASNGPMVENLQRFQEGAPRSRGAHRPVGTPDQHHIPCGRPAKGLCRGGPECWCTRGVKASPLPADVVALLRIWQSHLGESRDQCDEPGRKLWDRIEVALGVAIPQSTEGETR